MRRAYCLIVLVVVGVALAYNMVGGVASRIENVSEWARTQGAQSANLSFFLPLAQKFFGKSEAGGFTSADGRRAADFLCQPILDEAWKAVDSSRQYENRELQEFNRVFRWLNRAVPARAETTLCHLSKGMGLKSFNGLPVRTSLKYLEQKVDVEVMVPQEKWAIEAQYEAKAVVMVDGATSLVLYWSGKNGHSRGFLIEGLQGLYPEDRHQVGYLQWDRGENEQAIKYLGAEFQSAYLESVGEKGTTGDRAIYGELRYNVLTGAFHLQTTVMEPQAKRYPNQFGCYRWHVRGTKGDLVLIAQTEEALSDKGHARNTSFRDSTQMDAFWLKDIKTTPAYVGKLDPLLFEDWVIPGIEQYPFRKSCNDLYSAGVGDGAFGETDNEVRFSAEPNDIFSTNLEKYAF